MRAIKDDGALIIFLPLPGPALLSIAASSCPTFHRARAFLLPQLLPHG